VGGALCFTRKSEDLLPPRPISHRGPLLVEDSRWGGCWRVGFPGGLFPPLWCFPPCGVSPTVFGGCPPPVPLSRVAASFHVSVFRSLWSPGAWQTSRPSTRMLSAGRRACRRACWGGAGECSCGAPAVARHLPARVWRADARGLITPSCHRMKASAGSTRPTQSPSQTPQGGNTTGGKQHRGETAHGETHPPTMYI